MRRSILTLLVAAACAPPVDAGGSGDAASGDSGTSGPGPAPETTTFCIEGPPKVDVLFVVDGSASMGDEAAVLARNAASFGEVLDAAGERLDLTVAVTHTEAASCTDGLGALVDTSCRDRQASFVSRGGDGSPAADVFELGCASVCGQAPIDEGFASLACTLPPGIAACEDEAPLAALVAAIARSTDPQDPAAGWMRDDASLFAILVTDEDEPDDAQVLATAGALRALRDDGKRVVDPDATVVVAIAAGWDAADAPAGCSADDRTASAPTRLDVLRRAADDLVLGSISICEDDWTPLFAPIADALADQVRPLCIPTCVARSADGAAACTATYRAADDSEVALAPCEGEPSSWRVPDGADRCIGVALGDEIDTACRDEGAEAEAIIVVREGASPLGTTCVEVTCEVSETACDAGE